MTISTVSTKYQVVIPQEVRKEMNIQPGQKYHVMSYESGRIELIPVKSIKQMRGFLKGINSRIKREPDRL
jgi:AbrB family looped-hinge helix DNA binding protein